MKRYRDTIGQWIVKAVQFQPDQHPWPPEVQPYNEDFSPRGTYYGTVGAFRRDVSIAGGEWIIYDHNGFRMKRSDKEFRERYEEWHGIHYDGPWIPVEHSNPQEFGDVLVARWYDNPLGGRYSIELVYWDGCWKWDRPDRRTLYWMYLPPDPPHPPKPPTRGGP